MRQRGWQAVREGERQGGREEGWQRGTQAGRETGSEGLFTVPAHRTSITPPSPQTSGVQFVALFGNIFQKNSRCTLCEEKRLRM